MASCYRCGEPNANYRRTVSTGYSSGSWWGSKSHGSSSRTYYGTRSVCQSCAKAIDQWNTIKLVFTVIAVVLVILFCSNRSGKTSSNYIQSTPTSKSGKTGRVIATGGLKMRAAPDRDAQVLLAIPYNASVDILKNDQIDNSEPKSSPWVQVQYQGLTGWVWSQYLKMDLY